MRRILTLILAVFLICCSLVSIAAIEKEYILGVGDILNIQVVGLDAANSSLQNTSNYNVASATTVNYSNGTSGYMIRPDGKFEFPLIGEVDASGKTPTQLNKEITTRLAEYLVNPKVAINVTKFHTTRVYVLGEVVKPGLYELEREHNLVDAIGMAGGYTQYAAKKQVFVVRDGEKDKPISCNLLDIMEKGDISQNIELINGDVVYLSNNGKLNWTTDVFPMFQAIANAATTVGVVYNMK